MSDLYLYNSLSKQKELFVPLRAGKVSMYVCGPTVYDHPHLGNARSVVIYDVLYRLILQLYPRENITYVRNITDIDDKINLAAKQQAVPIKHITEKFDRIFHEDMEFLGCLPPTCEPRATDHIAEMIYIISLLLEKNHAYISEGHVYFRVKSAHEYGKVAGRVLEDLIAGARIEVAGSKERGEDFVLWKPCDDEDDISAIFDSPWGQGRPGWHIECSAMSYKYLGENFDIHGGGMDLVFPHHSNEIAQSCSAFAGSHYAKYWVHNGFLTVSGEKMSKSLGNFVTVRNLRDLNVKGEVIRYVLLSTHYRKPLDWNEDILHEAKTAMDSFYRVLTHVDNASPDCPAEALNCLLDDLNSHALLTRLHALTKQINKSSLNEEKKQLALQLKKSANLLGLLEHTAQEWFGELQDAQVLAKIAERTYAKSQKNWQLADKIREELRVEGIELEDNSDGTTSIIPL